MKPAIMSVVFIMLTHFVVVRGVKGGIEKAANTLMPLLLILLVILVIASCSLPGAMKGVEFLFRPDFSKVTGRVVLDAMGQAFFSLSLGTACLCTFGSYFKRDTYLLGSATQIALLDSGIAILAGLMIFPAAFSVGVQPDSGPSLIFITLPNVFQQAFSGMPVVGYVISIMFYALLVFAALTSTVSMHEIGTAFFHEELKISRQRAAWILTSVCALLAIFCSFSVGAYSGLQLFGMSLMDFCDFLTAQLMLPTGAFLTSIMLGWFVSEKLLRDEFTNGGTIGHSFFYVWRFTIRFIVPICILLIFLHQFGIL
jgi:NSS family neurotransmitter:Na+ symporter